MVGTNQHADRLLPWIEAAVELKEFRHQNPTFSINAFMDSASATKPGMSSLSATQTPASASQLRFDVIGTTHCWPLLQTRLPSTNTYYNGGNMGNGRGRNGRKQIRHFRLSSIVPARVLNGCAARLPSAL